MEYPCTYLTSDPLMTLQVLLSCLQAHACGGLANLGSCPLLLGQALAGRPLGLPPAALLTGGTATLVAAAVRYAVQRSD